MGKISFGTDGWRGVIADDFTDENVRKVTNAFASYILTTEKPEQGVIVGYDARFDSGRFARIAAETVSAAGIPVWLSSAICPTPAVSLLVRERAAAGGIQITASHNPYRWNGVKFKAPYGSSASPAVIAQIDAQLARVQREGIGSVAPREDLIYPLDTRAPYLERITRLVDWDRLRASNFRFVVDPMHGAACGLLREIFLRQGIKCDEIRGTHDPLFGGVHPEPIEPHIEALRIAVQRDGYDIGFAADGDGDRIGAIDRDGSFITPHQIFSILFWHLASARKLDGDVAKTFSTTKMIDKIAQKLGRKVWETPIGFKYICDRMLTRNILIGGEESGGIGTRLYLPERDATVNALLLAEVMAWHGKRLSELVTMLHQEFGEHHYGRIDLELAPDKKERALAYLADGNLTRMLEWPVVRRENLDGIKIYFGDIGWFMVRGSGTEPVLRIYSETTQGELTRRVLTEVASLCQRI
jgi:phosphomannomutase